MNCPLCAHPELDKFQEDQNRSYFRCPECQLISVPRAAMISFQDERLRYESHNNDENDPGYREYLNKIAQAIVPFLKSTDQGLDFGCGRTQLLAELLPQYYVDSFDLHFHPEPTIWSKKYDFIILSEVIEHLEDPINEMKKLAQLLRPGGSFYIKTKFHFDSPERFKHWFYKRDLTHIQFFNEKAMQKLAQILGMQGPEKLDCPDLHRIWFDH
jgi:SAM-dependent methyltransferase